jgi:hypothetical protein
MCYKFNFLTHPNNKLWPGLKFKYLNIKQFFSQLDVNWARAGLGLPLLEERIERKPHFSDAPTGPRPAPEGESMTLGAMLDGRAGAGASAVKETHIQVTYY